MISDLSYNTAIHVASDPADFLLVHLQIFISASTEAQQATDCIADLKIGFYFRCLKMQMCI